MKNVGVGPAIVDEITYLPGPLNDAGLVELPTMPKHFVLGVNDGFVKHFGTNWQKLEQFERTHPLQGADRWVGEIEIRYQDGFGRKCSTKARLWVKNRPDTLGTCDSIEIGQEVGSCT